MSSLIQRSSEAFAAVRIVPIRDLMAEDRGWTRGHAHLAFDDVPRTSSAYLDFSPVMLAAYQTIDASAGYPMHHHEGVETLTFVLEGNGVHEDSTGQRGVYGPGTACILSAGSGIDHAEFADESGPVRAVLFWVRDADVAGTPGFAARTYSRAELENRLCPLAAHPACAVAELAVRQSVALYAGQLEAGRQVHHDLRLERRAYLLATDGAVSVNGSVAQRAERVLAVGPGRVSIEALATTDVVLLDC